MALELKDPALLRSQAYVAGEWAGAHNGATREVLNPASGQKLGTVPYMGAAETRRAIEAAAAALPAWAKKTAQERALILRRWYDLMLANQEDVYKRQCLDRETPAWADRGCAAHERRCRDDRS